jgi:hypothetical protein
VPTGLRPKKIVTARELVRKTWQHGWPGQSRRRAPEGPTLVEVVSHRGTKTLPRPPFDPEARTNWRAPTKNQSPDFVRRLAEQDGTKSGKTPILNMFVRYAQRAGPLKEMPNHVGTSRHADGRRRV